MLSLAFRNRIRPERKKNVISDYLKNTKRYLMFLGRKYFPKKHLKNIQKIKVFLYDDIFVVDDMLF